MRSLETLPPFGRPAKLPTFKPTLKEMLMANNQPFHQIRSLAGAARGDLNFKQEAKEA
jgi:hypothetical protein